MTSDWREGFESELRKLDEEYALSDLSRLSYYSQIKHLITKRRLDRTLKSYELDRSESWLQNFIIYLIYLSQEPKSFISFERYDIIPASYIPNLIRRRSQLKSTRLLLDEIINAKSLRSWSLNIPEMSEYSSMRKLDEARQENENVISSGIKCNRCKSTRTIAESKQTRGGDEGETAFIKCLDCGKQTVQG